MKKKKSLCFVVAGIFISNVFMSGCAKNVTQDELLKELVGDSTVHSNYVEVDNLQMHYMEAGDGKPLILIHGWLCTGSYWKKVIPSLAEKYHVYAVDLIGHGLSDKPLSKNIKLSTDNQAKWVFEMMDKLDMQKAIIAGHSMGGEIAAKMALMEPDRVEGLILACAAGMEDNPKLMPWYVRYPFAGYPFLYDTVRFLHADPLAATFLNKLTIKAGLRMLMYYKENPIDAEFVNDLMLTTARTNKDKRSALKVTREGLFRDFLDEKASSINIPTLCVWARHDKVVPVPLGEQYHKLIPSSRLVVIDGAGHMVPWEKSDEFAHAIFSFCEEISVNEP